MNDDDSKPWDNSHKKIVQERHWFTRNGEGWKIGDMSDRHLLNAFKRTSDERLLAEMVVRLFEELVEDSE